MIYNVDGAVIAVVLLLQIALLTLAYTVGHYGAQEGAEAKRRQAALKGGALLLHAIAMRAKQPSTWVGLAVLGAYFGLDQSAAQTVAEIITPIAGAGLVLINERLDASEAPPAPSPSQDEPNQPLT